MGLETGVVNQFTIFPIALYDEGLGTPSAQETNPENAAFSVTSRPNCFPDSHINLITMRMRFSLADAGIITDKIKSLRACFMPIFMSFKEDYTAIDELSSLETQDILEMQTESTDRQGFPLYNDVKMVEKFAGSALMSTTMPGLTTTQVLEGVAFDINAYYNMLDYQTNSGKLKTLQGGLKWFTLDSFRNHSKTFDIRIRPKVKFMNPHTFFGVLIGMPAASTNYQDPVVADTTNINHLSVNIHTRFNEWNENFDFKKV